MLNSVFTMSNKFISDSYFRFFDELSANNNKPWFDANRERYEEEVKKPFRQLVEALTEELSALIPDINRNTSKAIFRINRDIRFSKNKEPYKLNMAAVFGQGGTTDHKHPSFYIHFGADEIMVGGGKYFCEKEEIAKIRQEIYYNHTHFKKIIDAPAFKKYFGTIQGEKNKVLEADYKAFAIEEPLIANKQFWYYSPLTRKQVTSAGLDNLLMQYMKAGLDFNRFLAGALEE